LSKRDWLTEQFEAHRGRLRGVAYRMVGSLGEADDAVQEAWLHVSRAGTDGVQNLGGWLTTVVARVCLDMLRARKSRREEPLEETAPAPPARHSPTRDPEQEALLAESVGLALLVVLDKLTAAERIAFVLHDLFAVPFEEIAPILNRTPAAARQLASRARRRVQGAPSPPDPDHARQRGLVEAFLAALRAGDLEGLVAVLDPDFRVRADSASRAAGTSGEARGARAWAQQALRYARGAQFVQLALVEGDVGLIMAPRGRLARALRFRFAHGKIAEMEIIGDPAVLRHLDLSLLPAAGADALTGN